MPIAYEKVDVLSYSGGTRIIAADGAVLEFVLHPQTVFRSDLFDADGNPFYSVTAAAEVKLLMVAKKQPRKNRRRKKKN
jgi:hypothetical protein